MAHETTIMLIDDHALFREGLKTIICQKAGYQVVGEAGNGRAAVNKIRKLKPDLALVDMSLPDISGIELTRELINLCPQTKCMIVSMHHKPDYVTRAFQVGALGYIVKESASDKLMKGIETVLKGEYYIDSAISGGIVKRMLSPKLKSVKPIDNELQMLTPREQEILIMLAEGLCAKEIAERLFISYKTVENHRTSIMNKLNIHSMVELIRYAIKLGLIDLDIWKEKL